MQTEQEAVITRRAFEAALQLTNDSADSEDILENVSVVINIEDSDGLNLNDRFGFDEPVLQNISDVSGTGVVMPETTASATWLILPTDEAAPTSGPTEYFVSGVLSYVQDGGQVTVPLYPVRIEVWPDASLFFKYFLQSPVYSDNPFSPEVEPAEPFSLGLMVTNAGLGTADNLRITSGQPQIIENKAGLLVSFEMIGAQVGKQQVSPSLTIDLGDVAPNQTAVARWLMISSLQGCFEQYEATFEHVNSLGDPRLSLIEGVDIYELNHVVLLDEPASDGLPDFLVNDPESVVKCDPANPGVPGPNDDFPDVIHVSDNTILPVLLELEAVHDGPITEMDLNAEVTAEVSGTGWIYFRLEDSGGDLYRLVQVVRNLPLPVKMLSVGDIGNAWTTHRWLPFDGPPTDREDRLHLLDYLPSPGPASYTLTYVPFACADLAACNDDNLCTDDACDPITNACIHTPNTEPCDDGQPETCQDQCLGGVCSGSTDECCTIFDLNGDGLISIVSDAPPFVACLYQGECDCADPGCTCSADCNNDDLATIVGDVPCFVECVFFDNCAPNRGGRGGSFAGGGRESSATQFTIGGAVYSEAANPLTSGIMGFEIELIDSQDQRVASTTSGSLGIWAVRNVRAGRYKVRFGDQQELKISVNAENLTSNQNITYLHRKKGDS